jgi:hypothetical protein
MWQKSHPTNATWVLAALSTTSLVARRLPDLNRHARRLGRRRRKSDHRAVRAWLPHADRSVDGNDAERLRRGRADQRGAVRIEECDRHRARRGDRTAPQTPGGCDFERDLHDAGGRRRRADWLCEQGRHSLRAKAFEQRDIVASSAVRLEVTSAPFLFAKARARGRCACPVGFGPNAIARSGLAISGRRPPIVASGRGCFGGMIAARDDNREEKPRH